jgi:hypothetical protein
VAGIADGGGTEGGVGMAAGGGGAVGVLATASTEARLSWATVARLAGGAARGVTAATRRSTEGIRTDRGIRPLSA